MTATHYEELLSVKEQITQLQAKEKELKTSIMKEFEETWATQADVNWFSIVKATRLTKKLKMDKDMIKLTVPEAIETVEQVNQKMLDAHIETQWLKEDEFYNFSTTEYLTVKKKKE